MLHPALRITQRYLVPKSFVSVYYFLRYGCFKSLRAMVQWSKFITIGKGTVVKPYSAIQTGQGKVSIGKNCSINYFCQIAAGDGEISMGDNVLVGPHVVILSSSWNYKRRDILIADQGFSDGDTTIEDDVLIASGTIIFKGCHIGEGAVIGANSVVTKSVPPYSVVVGSPARVIGKRE